MVWVGAQPVTMAYSSYFILIMVAISSCCAILQVSFILPENEEATHLYLVKKSSFIGASKPITGDNVTYRLSEQEYDDITGLRIRLRSGRIVAGVMEKPTIKTEILSIQVKYSSN